VRKNLKINTLLEYPLQVHLSTRIIDTISRHVRQNEKELRRRMQHKVPTYIMGFIFQMMLSI